MNIPDVDLDFKNREEATRLFPVLIGASQLNSAETQLVRHETGVYFQNIPSDPDSGLAVFPYEMAEEKGFMKFDFLTNRVYQEVLSPDELDALLEIDTDWNWYLDERFYVEEPMFPTLTHLGSHYETVRKHPPTSILDLAMLIAMIRPGKKHLLKKDRATILREVWIETQEGFAFKKSHAVSYGLMVSLHAKLIALDMGLL